MTLTTFVIVVILWFQFITFAHCIILILLTWNGKFGIDALEVVMFKQHDSLQFDFF